MINIIYADYIRTVLLFVLFLFLFLAGISDIINQKIPDLYIALIGITGLVIAYNFINTEVKSIICGMLSIAMFMITCVLIWKESFGGGDIKLMIISSAFLGFKGVWMAFATGILLSFPNALFIICSNSKKRYFPIGQYLCIGVFIEVIRIVYKG